MRAAIYIRVSTEEQAREGISLAMQEERLRQRLAADGIDDATLYRDDGHSASNLQRPDVQRLIADLPDLDILYVWKLDRLTRSQRDFHYLLDLLAEHRVGVVSLSEHFAIDQAVGKLVASVLAAVGEFQLDWMAENIIATLRHRVVTQGLQHGMPPIGYDYPRLSTGEPVPGEPMQIVTEPAALVRRIFALYAEGASLHELVRLSAEETWPTYTNRARAWSKERLRYLLRNPTYTGRVIYHDETHDGAHEAIISPDLWATVQQRLDRRGTGRLRRNNSTYGTLYKCGLCGGHIQGVLDTKGYGRYRCCSRMLLPHDQRHPPVGCPQEMADAIIDEWTRHLLDRDTVSAAVAAVAAELAADHGGEIAELDAQLADLAAQISYYHRAAARGMLPEEIADAEVRPLLGSRAMLLQRRERLTSTPAEVPTWLAEYADEGGGAFWEAPVATRLDLLMDLYERIDLFGDHLVIHHRLPLEPVRAPIPRHVRAHDRRAAACKALDLPT